MGQDLIREIENLPVNDQSRPGTDVIIANCGELVPQLKNKGTVNCNSNCLVNVLGMSLEE